MVEPVIQGFMRDIRTYQELAETCRKMAAASSRPGPLLERAQAFDVLALKEGEQVP